ncbi:hypothetical protein K466DRAFT_362396 [Polyporus arcularius HHB13444]|uniref:Uncharacterized protein n=1 Tax=Polyporus arcularius HHB13444 TaxID=1314778 RepID=A0A5C3PPE5_9APHY|nr:hypothetical protein K466DRAFT_362396 [Polyporus arcularius HHB13444]
MSLYWQSGPTLSNHSGSLQWRALWSSFASAHRRPSLLKIAYHHHHHHHMSTANGSVTTGTGRYIASPMTGRRTAAR